MFCPVCGNLVEDNTKFCGNCGNKFDNETVPAPAPVQDEADAIASFLSELDEAASSPKESAPIFNDSTEIVYQDTENRLFLDDDDEEDAVSDEAIVSQFFDNLDTLEEDASMDLTSEYKAENVSARKIAPVFEEIPDEIPVVEQIEEAVESSIPSFDDDYSDIVMGNEATLPPQPPVVPPMPISPVPTEPVVESAEESMVNVETENIQQELIEETPTIVSEEPKVEETLQNNVELESIDDEPHILIDERPDLEQVLPDNNIGDYNVNVYSPDASYTPYLDSFMSKPNVNVDFETPVSDINQDAPVLPNMQQEAPETPIIADVPNIPSQNNFQEMPPVAPINQPVMQQMPPQQVSMQQISQNEAQPMVAPPSQTKKKKKNTGIIVTLSIVGVLLIGILVTGFMLKDQLLGLFNPDGNTTIETPVVTDPPVENTKPDETNPTTPPETKPVDENPNWEIKENSGLDLPLITGEATLVSKYLDDTKTYENLQVKVSNILRGEEALTIAQNYEGQTTVRFEKPADGIEYVVVEYQVYIPAELNTNSTTANLPIEIRGLNTNGVVHNNISYIISTWCIEDAENSKAGSLVTCREIFQMPVDCNNYYIVLGTQGQTTAVYKGE